MTIPNIKKRKGCNTKITKKIIQQIWTVNLEKKLDEYGVLSLKAGYGTYTSEINARLKNWSFHRHTFLGSYSMTARYIKQAAATYFVKTDSYAFRITVQDIRTFTKTGETRQCVYAKPFTIELRVDANQTPCVLYQNKLIVQPSSIVQAYELLKIFQHLFHQDADFLKVFNQYCFNNSGDYYVARNTILKQLPVETERLRDLFKQGEISNSQNIDMESIESDADALFLGDKYLLKKLANNALDNERLNRRRRVLYHLKKGNTHKAVDAYLGNNNYPKSIRRELLKFDYLSNAYLDKLTSFLQKTDANHVLTVLKEHSADARPLSFKRALNVLEYSEYFNYKHLLTHQTELEDTIDMIQLMRNEADDRIIERIENSLILLRNDTKDIRRYHQSVINIYNNTALEYRPEWDEPYESQRFRIYQSKKANLVIRPLRCINEMVDIGSALSICTASYRQDQYTGDSEILVLTSEDDEYLACLEVDGYGDLVQAKLKYNTPVKANELYKYVIVQWAKKLALYIDTNDI